MGMAGNTISASAMGFGVQGNDYEAQFFESGNFTSKQYADFEALKANTPEGEKCDADAAAKTALGITSETVSPEE
jgi:hypothetical protein